MHAELRSLGSSSRRTLGRLFWRGVLSLFVLLVGPLHGMAWAATPEAWVIDKAELTGLAGTRVVQLPHVLESRDFLEEGSRVRYRLKLPLAATPVQTLGVLVTKLSLSGTLYINGQFVQSCDVGPLEELRCLHKINLFATPVSVWQVGDNVIEFEIYANARQKNGLSQVQVDVLNKLYQESFLIPQWLKHGFLVGLAWVSAVLGILSLAVSLVLRNELAYRWFGIACVAHALGILNLTVSRPIIDIEFLNWMIFSTRLVAGCMAMLTVLAIFDKLRRWMLVVLVGYCVLGPLAIGLGGSFRSVVVVIFFPLLLIGPALLFMAMRWAIESHNPLKLLTAGMMFVLVSSGIVDWLRLRGGFGFEGVFLFPYFYSAMLLILSTLLFRNLAVSLKESREDRDQLARRVAERMAYEVTEHIPVGTYTLVHRPGARWANFLFVSQRFLTLTGLDRTSILTDPHPFLDALHADDWAPWHQFLTHAPGQLEKFSQKFRLFSTGGQMHWLSTEAVPRAMSDGSTLYEGVLIDETDMVMAKLERDRVREALQQQQIEQSRMKEREQLLRDMHDGFGSQLAGVRMLAEKGRIPPEQFPQFLQELAADLHLVVDTLGQINITLEEALVDLQHRLNRRFSGIGLKLHWQLQLANFPPMAPRKILQTLRLIQEALNNAFKHAQAHNVWFAANYEAESDLLTLSVRDDGVGLVFPLARGRGLNNMRGRAREIGGEFQLIECHPGVEVLLTVPHVSLADRTNSK